MGKEAREGVAAVAAFLFCLLCQMPAPGAEGGGATGAELFRLRLAEVEKLGDAAVEESICGEVGILDNLWLGGDGRSYYEALMARWERCATEKSLPVLEGFLKNAAVLRARQADQRLPWLLFGTIERRGQGLWYRLRTAKLESE